MWLDGHFPLAAENVPKRVEVHPRRLDCVDIPIVRASGIAVAMEVADYTATLGQ